MYVYFYVLPLILVKSIKCGIAYVDIFLSPITFCCTIIINKIIINYELCWIIMVKFSKIRDYYMNIIILKDDKLLI